MKKFGLIGYPISGSLSPALMQAAYGGRYVYDLIETPSFDEAWEVFLRDYDGINVTAPFKEAAFDKVLRGGDVSDLAAKTGAANLIVKTPSGLRAYNTDVEGIRRAIAPAVSSIIAPESINRSANSDVIEPAPGKPSSDKKALVVGAGGAGRAAIVAAFEEGFDVMLVNRTYEKAVALSEEMEEVWFSVNPLEDLSECVRAADLIIYTVPVPVPGLHAKDFEGKWILEANYKTPCLGPVAGHTRSAVPGSRYISGREWLLQQAAAGYHLFTGEEPDFAAMRDALP